MKANMNTELKGDIAELEKTRSCGGPEVTEKIASASSKAIVQLTEKGYDIIVSNGGLHLKIKHDRFGLVDYWPTTQKWWIAKYEQRGNGLRALIQKLGFVPKK
jgi:hypothetical protein